MTRLVVAGRLDVDFETRPGEVIAVIGPNGAGKSTLLHALAGLVPGNSDRTLPRDRNVGYVFQDQRLFPHLTALDNVAFGPRSRGVRRSAARIRARDWLTRLGVGELAARKPNQLSGGQAQRVALARALVTEPELLLLDEPMAGLDVRVATALRIDLAQHLREFPGVAVLVTHDAIDALTIADRVVVLERGQIVQDGPPQDVAARPQSEHVARLVGLNIVNSGSEVLAFSPHEVTITRDPSPSSARLRWSGQVAGVTPHGDAVRVSVRAEGGPAQVVQDLLADVTAEAVTELGLSPGRRVWLTVKATSVRRYPQAGDR